MSVSQDAAVRVHAVEMTDVPDVEVAPRAKPRSFSASYKARVLAEFEALPKSERAGFLRREGLYSTLIRKWQKQALRAAEAKLTDRAPGRPAADPRVKEIAGLKAQIARLEGELADSRRIADVQAKLFALLGELSRSAANQDRPGS
jgi:transposase